MKYPAPLRRWESTGNYTADGKPMFSSRDWLPGEKAEYVRQVKAAAENPQDGPEPKAYQFYPR